MSDPKASDETTDQDSGNNEANESVEEIEAARKERLAPENRPENAEVDNTDRTFDEETGYFTDSEGHDSAERKFVNEDLGGGDSGDTEKQDSGDTEKQDSGDAEKQDSGDTEKQDSGDEPEG
ncbi:MAG: hypothetical protein M3130_10215 [Actinomycetota bacterium]|nr:hypothetical protein [Actinomycetota bacterium]